MDEPKLPISPPDPSGPIGADATPVPSDRDHVESAADPLRENSHVVYCGNAEELSEGFAIALRIMGLKQSR